MIGPDLYNRRQRGLADTELGISITAARLNYFNVTQRKTYVINNICYKNNNDDVMTLRVQ